jgi:hypothetical protein
VVRFQRYDANGNLVGQETMAGTRSEGFQSEASVIALAGGGWVVAWTASSGSLANSVSDVYARVFPVTGLGGSDIKINNDGLTGNITPTLAALQDGGWLATWACSTGIYGQRHSASGQAVGSAFKVSEATLVKPAVTGLTDGGWLVSWTHWPTDNNAEILARRYLASGDAADDAFQVNTFTDGMQISPTATGLNDGGWLVVWQSMGRDAGADGASAGIYAQRYSANGVAMGSEFRVNTHLANEQSLPSVTRLTDGGWLVTWQSLAQETVEMAYGVYGQRYSATGTAMGDEFGVNTHTPDIQGSPTVAALPNGGWVVSWMSQGQDGSGGGIYAQAFDANGLAAHTGVELTALQQLVSALSQVNTLPGATEDTPFTITWQALADAADEEMPEGDVLFFRVEEISSGSLTLNGIAVTAGAAVIGAGQAAVWTPAADANGTLPAFKISAFNGERASVQAQVQVAVAAVEDAPSSADALLEMQEDQPRVLRLEDFGYSDQDGDALALLHLRMADSDALALQFQVAGDWVTQAAGDHSITPADVAAGLVRLLPTANFNGALDTALGFDLADASGQWSSQAPPTSPDYLPTFKLAVDVAAVNDAPTLSVPSAQQANGKQAMVLSSANGNALSIGDVDLHEAGSDTLQVTLRVSDGKGTLALNNPAGLEGEVGAVPKDSLLFWGTVPAINAALAAGLTLSPGVAGIDVSVSDGTAAATATVTIEGAMVTGQYIQGDGSGGGGGGQSGLNDGAAGGDGGGDNDTLTGSAGDDILFGDGSGGGGGGTKAMLGKAPGAGGAGGAGADHLHGGKGNDILFGDGFDGLAGSTRGGAGGLGGGGGGGGAGGVGVPFEGQGGIGGLAAGRGNSGSPYLPAPLAPLVEGMDSTNSLPDSTGRLGTGGWTPEYFDGGGGGGGFGGAAGGNGGYLSWNANQAGANGDKAPHTYSDDNGNLAAYLSQPSVLRSLLTQYPKYGRGNDTLDGGAGSDQLFGLGGADTFVFDLATAMNGDTDRVWDFSAEDRLLLLYTEPVPLDALHRMVAQATAVDADGDGQQDDLRLSHGNNDRLMQIELINTQSVHVDEASASVMKGQPKHLPTGSVGFSGTASPGQTLSAANTLADLDGMGTVSYQWLLGGQPIAGAQSPTLVIAPDQAGQQISVRASYTDQQGTAEAVDSASVQVNTPPVARDNAYTIAEDAILVLGNLISDGWAPGTAGQTWFHDTDADGDTLVISAVTVGDVLTAWADLPNSTDPADLGDAARGNVWKAIALPHGSAWLQADGTLRYTGQANDALGYTISDGQGGTVSAQADIRVLAAPATLSITHWKAGKGALAGVALGTAQNGQAITTDADGRANVRGLAQPDGDGPALLQPKLEVSRSQAGITLTDVLGALKVYLGKPLPEAYNNDLKFIAADFDGNGTVNLTDVLGLLKFYLNKPVNAAPAWVFVDSAQTTTVNGQTLHLSNKAGQTLSTAASAPSPILVDVNSDESVQLLGVLRGDVDGSWVG